MIFIFTTIIIVVIAVVMFVYLGRSYANHNEASPPKTMLEEQATTQKAVFDTINRNYETEEALLLKKDRLAQDFHNAQRVFDVGNEKYLQNMSDYVKEIATTNCNLMQRLQDKHRTTTMNIFQQKEQVDAYLTNKLAPYSNVHHMYNKMGYDRTRDVFQAYNFELIDSNRTPITDMRLLNTQMDILIDEMRDGQQGVDSNFSVINTLERDIANRSNLFADQLKRNQEDILLFTQTFSNDISAIESNVNEYLVEERDMWTMRLNERETVLKSEFDRSLFQHINTFQRMAFEAQTNTMSNTNRVLGEKVLRMRTDIDTAKSNITGRYRDFALDAQTTLSSTLSVLIRSNVTNSLTNVGDVYGSNLVAQSNISRNLDTNNIKVDEFQQYIIDHDVRSNVYTKFVLDTMNSTNHAFEVNATDLRTSNSNVTFQKMYEKYVSASNATSSKLQRVNAMSANEGDRGLTSSSIKIHKWKPVVGNVTRMDVGNSKWQARGQTANMGPHVEIDRDIRVNDILVKGEPLVNAEGKYNGGGTGTDSISSRIETLQSNFSSLLTVNSMNTALQNIANSNHDHNELNQYQRKDDPLLQRLQNRINNIAGVCGETDAPCLNGKNLKQSVQFESDHFDKNSVRWNHVDWNKVEFPQQVKNSLKGVCSDRNQWTGNKVVWGSNDASKIPLANATLQNIPMRALNISSDALLRRLSISAIHLPKAKFSQGIVDVAEANDLTNIPRSAVRLGIPASSIQENTKVSASNIQSLRNTSNITITGDVGANTMTYTGKPMVFEKQIENQNRDCFFWDNKIICEPGRNQVMVCMQGGDCYLYNISRTQRTDVPISYFPSTTSQSHSDNLYYNQITGPDSFSQPTAPFRITVTNIGDENGCAFDHSRAPIGEFPTQDTICQARSNFLNTTITVDSNLTVPVTNPNNSCQALTNENFDAYLRDRGISTSSAGFKAEIQKKTQINGTDIYVTKRANQAQWSGTTDVNMRYTASNCPTLSCSYQTGSAQFDNTTPTVKDSLCGMRSDKSDPTIKGKTLTASTQFKISVPPGMDHTKDLSEATLGSICKNQFDSNIVSIQTTLSTLAGSDVSFTGITANNTTINCSKGSISGGILDATCRFQVSNMTASNCFTGTCAPSGTPTIYYKTTNRNNIEYSSEDVLCASNPGTEFKKYFRQEQYNSFLSTSCGLSVGQDTTFTSNCSTMKYTIDNSQEICLNGSLSVIDTSTPVPANPQSGTVYKKITISTNGTSDFLSGGDFFQQSQSGYQRIDNNTLATTTPSTTNNYYIKTTSICQQQCNGTSLYEFNPASEALSGLLSSSTTVPTITSWNVDSVCQSANTNTTKVLQYKLSSSCSTTVSTLSINACCRVPVCNVRIGTNRYDLTNSDQRAALVTSLNTTCPSTNPTVTCGTYSLSQILSVSTDNTFSIKSTFTPPGKSLGQNGCLDTGS